MLRGRGVATWLKLLVEKSSFYIADILTKDFHFSQHGNFYKLSCNQSLDLDSLISTKIFSLFITPCHSTVPDRHPCLVKGSSQRFLHFPASCEGGTLSKELIWLGTAQPMCHMFIGAVFRKFAGVTVPSDRWKCASLNVWEAASVVCFAYWRQGISAAASFWITCLLSFLGGRLLEHEVSFWWNFNR